MDPSEGQLAIVIGVGRGTCEVQVPGAPPVQAQLTGDIAKIQQSALAVGDEVRLQERPGAPPLVVEVLPRRTALSRPDPMDPHIERAIVANVDVVVIVCAAKNPAFKPRLIDRYMVAIERGGARPLVAVNKADLVPDRRRPELQAQLQVYRDIGVPVFLTSTSDGEGLEALRAALRGQTAAFVGHSGVGKSSLLNALAGGQAADIGRVRTSDGKGRHTTTHSALFVLPDGTRIIDTPGIRAFGLHGLSREELRHSFPEFDGLRCRYGDCLHDREPEADCGVKRAVAEGGVNPARYDTYLRLLRDL